MRLSELARTALQMAAENVDALATESAARGKPVACRRGCGACCRQLLTVSPAEAWMLAEEVAALEESRRETFRMRLTAVRDVLRNAGMLARLASINDPALDDAAHYQLANDYFHLGAACPFLDPDGACGIHPFRPALCREYCALGGSASCDDPFLHPVEVMPNPLPISDALGTFCASYLGDEVERIPLALALDWAAAHPEPADRAWDAAALMRKFSYYVEAHRGFQE
jgi:Fe-S-cluster containining protein